MRTGTLTVAAAAVLVMAGSTGGIAQASTLTHGGGYRGPASSSAPASTATVKAAKSKVGTILVDGQGRTLYLFEKDKGGKSACSGECAAVWPPLITSGKPTAGAGVNASWLSTTQRPDGKTQVTYHNWPLYYYAGDSKAGDMTGQDINGFGAKWYVVGAATGGKMEMG